MASLPTRLADIRNLFQALEWDKLSLQVEKEAHARLAIVGPVNSGKSTLFNLLKGRKVSAVNAIAPSELFSVVDGERCYEEVLLDLKRRVWDLL